MHGVAVVRAVRAGVGFELGQAVQRQVDFGAGAFAAKVADRGQEFRIEIALFHQAQESPLGVEIARHRGRADFLAVFEYHSRGPAFPHQQPGHLGVDANFGPGGARGRGDGLR